MISHKHKCIFIHVSKCAGSSIEKAFNIKINDNTEKNNINLFGWNSRTEMFLQHATPQQLLDYNFITHEEWASYFKFIVVRNPYDRAISDYKWLLKDSGITDSFENFLKAKGKFERILTIKDYWTYRGDHLVNQLDYFKLNDSIIEYDLVLRFESLTEDLETLCSRLALPSNFFIKRVNTNTNKKKHYSKYYNTKLKEMVEQKYWNDLSFLNYSFNDKRNFYDKLINSLFSI